MRPRGIEAIRVRFGWHALRFCEGRGAACVGIAFPSRRTGGWREAPAEEEVSVSVGRNGPALRLAVGYGLNEEPLVTG